MPFFPTFRRPCPYQADLAAVMEGDWCRKCGQQVHDITDLDDAERLSLLRDCGGDVCVSYRLPAALAAAALVTSGVSASQPHHHAHKAVPVAVPVVTLAGAPVAPPAPASLAGDGAKVPSAAATPAADPQSSR